MTQFTRISIRGFLQLFLLLLFSLEVCGAQPDWLNKLPRAKNKTYRYDVTHDVGTTYDEARDKAVAIAYEKAIQTLGLAYNSNDLEKAKKSGELVSLGHDFNIPLRVVCEFEKRLPNNDVEVYILCQVAVSSNIDVQFTEFRDCDLRIDNTDCPECYVRPSAWSQYEEGGHISHYELVKWNGGKKLTKDELESKAKNILLGKLLNDSAMLDYIEVQSLQNDKAGHAIAFVEMGRVMERFSMVLGEHLNTCGNWLENGDSYILEGKDLDAHATAKRIVERLAEADKVLVFLHPYLQEWQYKSHLKACVELKTKANEMLTKTENSARSLKGNKVREYISLAKGALESKTAIVGNVGDALKYLYAALLMLTDMPDGDLIKVEDSATGQQIPAKIYAQSLMKQVLRDVEVTCEGLMPGSKSEIKLNFRYKGAPTTNISYEYNANAGNSSLINTINSWGTAFLPENNMPKTIHVYLNYRCSHDEANFDASLPALIDKYQAQLRFDEYAQKVVAVNTNPIDTRPASVYDRNSTALNQNIVANLVQETNHRVSSQDSARYAKIIMRVCNAIRTKQADAVLASCFTLRGQKQYEKLLKYGNARIVSTDGMRYVRMGADIQCRSIPMCFTFSKGKSQFENVAFTLVDTLVNGVEAAMIDGVQFALEERAARNIMGQTEIDETARLLLVSFMENYKTAFAMQNWDYIENIFADDAIIITGRVVKSNHSTDFNQIKLNSVDYLRQSKAQYMNRLRNTNKEWINIKFGDTNVEKSSQTSTFGISLYQDYFSSNYGDHGYLFLLIDASDAQYPLIRVRAWQPNEHFVLDTYNNIIDQISNQHIYENYQ